MFDNRKWVIINLSDLTDEMLENSIQRNTSNARKSVDGSKILLKWDGETPSCFEGETIYNHSEIMSELSKETWTKVDPQLIEE
tara:strand:- start:309 stop:557 length:249 start_codon:yes stop_codon:yes gene_type:complete